MGNKLEPNYWCLPPVHFSGPLSEANCYCSGLVCPEFEHDCILGLGTCYYDCFTTYWAAGICHCWHYVTSDSCVEPTGDEYLHDGDIPRTILYDYNLTGGEPCFMDRWKRDDQKTVIRYTNLPTSTNIKILIDPTYFIP